MGQWTSKVLETLQREVQYTVEADTAGEAFEKLVSGETVKEAPARELTVTNRMVGVVEFVTPDKKDK